MTGSSVFNRRDDDKINLYEADRDVFSLIMKHMPFASKESMSRKKHKQEMIAYDADAGPQSASRRMDAMHEMQSEEHQIYFNKELLKKIL